MADAALVPSLAASSSAADRLAAEVAVFCAEPSTDSRELAQEAWRNSKQAWQQAILTTWFGPAQMLRTVSRVDYEPVNEQAIEELLVSTETLDTAYVLNQAASTVRGLGTIEYLLFDPMDRGSEDRVCDMLTAAAEVVASETLGLEEAWTVSYQQETPFLERFAGGSMASDDAMADAVSAIVETLKQMSLFQLGKAMGISSQEPLVAAIPEGRAGAGAVAYVAQLEGVRLLLDGGGEASLGALIEARSEEIAAQIDQHLDAAIAELTAIQAPLREVAADDPHRLHPLYDHVAELLRLFEADVVSLLDITLGFSDADGDSG
ncbi:MAG: imelysin family protein [Actinomycetota bacterium]|nr:imelysin family protein [Actinomycetota bacterium]